VADRQQRPRTAAGEAEIHLWAALGTPNTPPDRLQVEVCARCGALIPVEHAAPHAGWHDRGRR